MRLLVAHVGRSLVHGGCSLAGFLRALLEGVGHGGLDSTSLARYASPGGGVEIRVSICGGTVCGREKLQGCRKDSSVAATIGRLGLLTRLKRFATSRRPIVPLCRSCCRAFRRCA